MRHHAAVRALAFMWIRVPFRCSKNRTPYDKTRYLQVLECRRATRISTPESAPAAKSAGVTDNATPVGSDENSE